MSILIKIPLIGKYKIRLGEDWLLYESANNAD
ncbi:hypothetical protein DSM04_102125 [Leeuwenhoekiella aestuarii]|uniref:Uncharacterized protein n=1 Tax=Leeuwenhoekiella aestuarii TaxID=2249426 RepID=A0A4Q0NYZ6_9FLAO|nr:hypothetical protein DSM04_102125 [Leeuwenhoekiella aestuarii]